MNDKKIHIMLLDDHPAIRYGLAMAIDLEDDMIVSAQSSDVEGAIAILSQHKIDVVLVDISLHGNSDGFDFIKAVNERYRDVRTLVLSMYDEALYAERAILGGAMGFITKKEPIVNVITGIREVMKGNLYINGDISGRLIMKLMNVGFEEKEPLMKLTPREREILRFIGAGFTPIEIAKKINISVNTVETHRKNIKEKLGIPTSRELFKFAIKTLGS